MLPFLFLTLLAGAAAMMPIAESDMTDEADTDTDVVDETDAPTDSADTDEETQDDDTSDEDTSSDDDALDDDELIEDELPLIIPVLEIPETPELGEDAIIVTAVDDIDNSEDTEGQEYFIPVGKVDDLLAGSGDDVFVVDTNTVTSSGVFIEIDTGDGDNTVFVDPDQEVNTLIEGGAGDDTFFGGLGYDSITDFEGSNVGFGNDHRDIISFGDDSTIYGGEGHDSLYAGDSSAVAGGSGNDTITLGDDGTAEGGSGNDTITAGDDASIYGGEGNDRITAGSGGQLFGGAGNDSYDLTLGPNGDAPAVIHDFVSGEDTLNDIRVLVDTTGDVDIDFEIVAREDGLGTDLVLNGEVILEVFGAETEDLENVAIETVGAGTITDNDNGSTIDSSTDASANTVFGNGGNDTIIGAENDVIYGGDGDDIITAENKYSWSGGITEVLETELFGGEGADTFEVNTKVFTDVFGGEKNDQHIVEIADFDADEDVIVLKITSYDDYPFTPRHVVEEDITIVAWEDGLGADILMHGVQIVTVAGGQDLQIEDIALDIDYVSNDQS